MNQKITLPVAGLSSASQSESGGLIETEQLRGA